MEPISTATGNPVDQTRLFVIFLVQFPVGWIMHFFIHGTLLRHLYTITIGIAFQVYLFGEGIKHVFLMITVAYILMNVLPRN